MFDYFTATTGGFNQLQFNYIGDIVTAPGLGLPEANEITYIFDTEVVPIEQIGERYEYANSPWTRMDGMSPLQWLVSRTKRLYFVGHDGYLHQYDIGVTNDGNPINAYYVTNALDFDAPNRIKRLRWMELESEAIEGSFLRIFYKIDNGSHWKLLAELDMGHDKYPFIQGPPELFRVIIFKFETAYEGCRFRINTYSLDLAIRGQHKEVL